MPDLPSGTVTFLLTDIEGSTALWERDQHAMVAAVARHIALLDAAIQAHDGVHFKTVGDAVQAAFPTAPDAITAALDAQRSLLTEDWGEIGPLRVRMALHAGEAMVHNEEYQGPLLMPSPRRWMLSAPCLPKIGVKSGRYECAWPCTLAKRWCTTRSTRDRS
jgi:class 3 adenylate cyclase